jgi:membrane protein implicated in regulation of membrane protease activity
MYAVAIPSTIILIIQLIMTFTADISDSGGADSDISGDIDADTDISGDTDGSDIGCGFADSDSADDSDLDGDTDIHELKNDLDTVRIFTLRGIIAFLCSFSWCSLALVAVGAPVYFAAVIGFAVGVAMMFAVAKLIHTLLGLSENGTVDFASAVGAIGKVYIPIPPVRSGMGKIIITLQGAELECSAETLYDEAIPTGTEVVVTEVDGETLICAENKSYLV